MSAAINLFERNVAVQKLDGSAPQALDTLAIGIDAGDNIEIIDMEFKAGTKAQIRIV